MSEANELRALVLNERPDSEALGVATALRESLGHDDVHVGEGGKAVSLAVVLDPEALRVAREAGVPRCVAFMPEFGNSWDESLTDADLVIVTHPALVADVVAQGVSRSVVRVVDPVVPHGMTRVENKSAAREALGLEPTQHVVVVRASAIADELKATLVQLALVKKPVSWLFDVESNVELAETLRAEIRGHGLEAWMFADVEGCAEYWQAADVVMGELHGGQFLRAMATGAALVAMPPTESQLRLAHILETDGVVEVCDSSATLAVTIERVLSDAFLAKAKEAGKRLKVDKSADAFAQCVRDMLEGKDRWISGLPSGLERISKGDVAIDAPAASTEGESAAAEASQIDSELKALRERLGL